MRESIWGISWPKRSLWQINTPKSSQRFQLIFDVLLASSTRRSWCRTGAGTIEDNGRNLLLAYKLVKVSEIGLDQLVPFRDLLIAALLEQVEDFERLLRRRCVSARD